MRNLILSVRSACPRNLSAENRKTTTVDIAPAKSGMHTRNRHAEKQHRSKGDRA